MRILDTASGWGASPPVDLRAVRLVRAILLVRYLGVRFSILLTPFYISDRLLQSNHKFCSKPGLLGR